MAHAKSPRLARLRPGTLVLTIVVALMLATISYGAAEAATYRYSNQPTGENVSRNSGPQGSMSGAKVVLEPFSVDGAGAEVGIETYVPYPGYRSVNTNVGAPTLDTDFKRVTNVQQRCWWNFPHGGGSIGSLKLSCWFRS